MLTPLFELFAAVPILTVLLAVVATWLVRRRPGGLRHGWLVGFGALLVAADAAEPLPLPAPEPGTPAGIGGAAIPARHTLSFGVGGGSFQTCAGARTYGDVGAMYAYTTPIGPQTNVEVRGGTYGAFSGGVPSGALHASVGIEHRWVGARVGAVSGALERDGLLDVPVLPSGMLRLGPRDAFFVEAQFLDDFPAPLPGPMFGGGVGVAFPRLGNQWEPFRVRAGVSGAGVYVAPTIPLGDVSNLEILGAYGDASTWGATAVFRMHTAAGE